jgi:predicted HicB family RNase H-like nuclease
MVKKANRMGRPPKKAKDRRTKPVALRVTPGDHKQLVRDAANAGLSISAYLLECWRKEKVR